LTGQGFLAKIVDSSSIPHTSQEAIGDGSDREHQAVCTRRQLERRPGPLARHVRGRLLGRQQLPRQLSRLRRHAPGRLARGLGEGRIRRRQGRAAQRFPEITFKATELTRDEDDTVSGKGELTIKGVTQPITLTGTIAPAPATDPFGRERLGLKLESSIDRTDYGVNWNAPNQSGGDYLANDVKLIAELALVKAEA
jgi:hypothetical protein